MNSKHPISAVALALLILAVAAFGLSATSSGASSQWDHHQGGIWCKTKPVAGAVSVLCVPESGKGWGVGINKNFVMVVNLATGKSAFVRLQP